MKGMTNRARIGCLVLGLSSLASAGCGHATGAREVHIAAAANLRAALDEIARAFESRTGIHVVSTIGSTAQLAQQIENGAPVEVFLAADTQPVDQQLAGPCGSQGRPGWMRAAGTCALRSGRRPGAEEGGPVEGGRA